MERGRTSVATPVALAFLILLAAHPDSARADWSPGVGASVRHDDNVGNAQDSTDIVQDTIIAVRLSAFQFFPLADGYSFSFAGGLSGESFNRFTGLNNATLDTALGLKKKWGLGAFAPWARAAVSLARSDYDEGYRNAWIYRATLGTGRRIDERWNLWAEYAYEARDAVSEPDSDVPGVSGDAYSQRSNSLAAHVEFSLSERTHLGLALLGRHGDVVSTTAGSAKIFYASRALADDPTFGPEAYAYRLVGTSVGFRLGLDFSPTPHCLLGFGFQRLETRAEGGNNYAKSLPEITWDYRF